MRTSLNEIQQIEDHLFQKLSGEDEVLFQANVLLDRDLAENLKRQEKSYQLIYAYGRKQLRQEIEAVHHKLFNLPGHRSFRQKILAIFRA